MNPSPPRAADNRKAEKRIDKRQRLAAKEERDEVGGADVPRRRDRPTTDHSDVSMFLCK